MWLIFCGAYDNEMGCRGRGRERTPSGAKSHQQGTAPRKFNLLQCLFFHRRCSGCCWLLAVEMRRGEKGIKKRDKIFKTLQLDDITFIHKLWMRG